MNFDKLKFQVDEIIAVNNKVYLPDNLILIKFISNYRILIDDMDFNVSTFGVDMLIQYFNSWSNKERFGKLEYYSKLLASGEFRGGLFVLYATVKINDAIISFLRTLPEETFGKSKEVSNRILYKLQRSIEHLDSISDKLEVLKEFYEKQIESKIEIPEIFKDTPIGHVAFMPEFREKAESVSFEIFPESRKFYTSLFIPENLFRFNFEFVQDDSEYTFWFIKYNARKHFESYIMSQIYEDLLSPLREEHIAGYLSDLEQEVITVKSLVSKHLIHSYKENSEYSKETEVLRIIEGYYELNPLSDLFSRGNLTVEQYARHICLKEYLMSLRSEPQILSGKALVDYFADHKQYHVIMDILVREGKCHKDTHIWIDSGSGSKMNLAELFTILHMRGYLLNNVRIKHSEKQAIALNTFGVELSIDTAKRSSKPSENEFQYIPLASKLTKLD